MILNYIFEWYVIFSISVVLHELAHLSCAKAIGLSIQSLHIGDECFAVKFGRVHISPITFYGGFVEFDEGEMREKRLLETAAFFSSGAIINTVLIAVALIIPWEKPIYGDMLLWLNVYLLISSFNPIFPRKNDMNRMLKYMKEKRAAGGTSRC